MEVMPYAGKTELVTIGFLKPGEMLLDPCSKR